MPIASKTLKRESIPSRRSKFASSSWDPAGNYGYQYVLWLAGYCTSHSGYYYETADGGYSWNAC